MPADLDIPILGQLTPAQLPLGDALEPGPLEIISLDAPLGRGALREQPLEHPPRPRTTPWYSPISTPNSTGCRSAFQRASSGKVENMATALPIELAIWQNTSIMPDIVGKSPWASTAERYPRSRLSRSRAMPLTSGLLDVLLSHPCPRCGHKQEKKGSWFKTISHYTCPSCGHSVQMGYDEQIRLFDANAHRAIE